MSFFQIVLLAFIQGAAELLPISSSAHVIIAQKFMGFDPSAPEMTFLLVMLHTGTMFATIIYFWDRWKVLLSGANRNHWIKLVAIATVVTLILGLGIKSLLERFIFRSADFQIEDMFNKLPIIAGALFAVGILIIYSGKKSLSSISYGEMGSFEAFWIGVAQGIALPFRGFSRSGSTISAGLLMKLPRLQTEEFSFLLALVLTPPVIARSIWRLWRHPAVNSTFSVSKVLTPGLIGMVASFFAGLLALKYLTAVLEKGKWVYFGYYCVVASFLVLVADHFL
ncbi:MAG: UDP-diphosphatase [Bacteriovoracaceae bacterium]|nr:UDP-diphosphatase [Bacteriovoracaceae bacterium]